MIMEGRVQLNPVYGCKGFRHQRILIRDCKISRPSRNLVSYRTQKKFFGLAPSFDKMFLRFLKSVSISSG